MRPLIAALILATLVPATPLAAADAPSEVAGLKADLIANLTDAENKLVGLAEATPQDKFGWRPTPEVRTTAQVYLHVAGGLYFLSNLLGAPRPEAVPKDIEALTDKAEVIAALKVGFAHARQVIESAPESAVAGKVKVPWGEMTYRGILIALATHTHEHLGQAIAYARSVGVVPPWSAGGVS
ncbi:MAG TPA: DinB family protein [Thermoanaerobaculia bacterium]|nr:DinB family protein [Thermoanaerobaculia bacterium]